MSQRSGALMTAGLLLAIVLLGSPQVAQVQMDWQGLEAAWNAYKDDPVADKAIAILNLLPNNVKIIDTKDGLAVINMISDQLSVLKEAIYSGEPNAFKLGFRFCAIANGPFEATLNMIIGNLIVFNPKLFLEELTAQRSLFSLLDPIVTSFLQEMPEDKVSQGLEIKVRIKSLESVEEKPLKALRNQCIAILKKL